MKTTSLQHQISRSRRVISAFFSCLLFLTLLPQAHAIKFSNQFAEFELPPRWQCNLEGAEWVCQNTDDTKKRDAIVVLAAKLKGDLDTLERYQQYLNGPRVFTAPNGSSVKSAPKYTKTAQINGHPWVDSLHMESEIPGFYTRYLATIKQDIGILVTYSINKTKYNDYQGQFEEMVKSLKVFRKAGSVNQMANTSLFNQNTAAIGTSGLFQPQAEEAAKTVEAPKPEKKQQASNNGELLFYGALGLGVVGFIAWRKRQGG